MPLAICGVQEVPAFASVPLQHIISIRELHQPAPDIRGFKTDFTLHSFVFADANDTKTQYAPTENIIQRLLDIYAKTTIESTILFHCFAGVSRSTAAAFLWLVYHGIDYDNAYKACVSLRGPFISPNELMIRLADKLMNKNGEMIDFVTKELARRGPERAAWFKAHERH